MQIGGVTPGFHEGEETSIWRCPIEVYLNGHRLKVTNVYTEEGIFCMDVEQEEK